MTLSPIADINLGAYRYMSYLHSPKYYDGDRDDNCSISGCVLMGCNYYSQHGSDMAPS